MKKEIQRQWCVYGGIVPWGFGKIEEDSGKTVDIRYTEAQQYHPTSWKSNYVKRFETLEEAMEFFRIHGPDKLNRMDNALNLRKIEILAREAFPSYFKK